MLNNPTIRLSDLSSYSYGTGGGEEDSRPEIPTLDKMKKLRTLFEQNYTSVKTVRAVILVLLHNHPHVLLLKKNSSLSNSTLDMILPGGKLEPGEDDETGLQRLLAKKMKIVDNSGSYEINELIACWYRPQFTEQMLPYCPVHITTAKEIERWYLVLLPEKGMLGISPKYTLNAVPFYDFLDSSKEFNKQISSIPLLVSRFNILPRTVEDEDQA